MMDVDVYMFIDNLKRYSLTTCEWLEPLSDGDMDLDGIRANVVCKDMRLCRVWYNVDKYISIKPKYGTVLDNTYNEYRDECVRGFIEIMVLGVLEYSLVYVADDDARVEVLKDVMEIVNENLVRFIRDKGLNDSTSPYTLEAKFTSIELFEEALSGLSEDMVNHNDLLLDLSYQTIWLLGWQGSTPMLLFMEM